MLYVSTRNNANSFTAYRALHEDRTPDGGYFVPQKLQTFSKTDLSELINMTFGERIARVLNIFFPVGMNGWDVEFAIGRHPCKLIRMNHRLYIAELWHNLQTDFRFMERALYTKLCENDPKEHGPASWVKIAIRIAVLFGVYGELAKSGVMAADFANITGDYAFITAAIYAQKMGLPVGKIICTSDENGGVWGLFRRGELSLSGTDENQYFELLVYEVLGAEAVKEYLRSCKEHGIYRLDEEQLMLFNQIMDGAVVSRTRCAGLIRSIYRTHDYIAEPYLAIAYGGLQDYRARTGESRTTLLISDVSPKAFESLVTEATGVTPAEMRKIISSS